jgi:Na+/phosphate symporter
MKISLAILFLLVLLYFFLLGLELLGTSFKVVGGCTAGSLLGSDANPLTGVMIGIIATAILQSSSTTTSIIVSLVSGGLEVSNGICEVTRVFLSKKIILTGTHTFSLSFMQTWSLAVTLELQ